ELRNFNLQDGYTDTGSEDLDLTFPAPPGGGVIVSQTVRMVVDEGSGSLSGRFSLRDPDNFDDPVLLLEMGSGGEYGYQTVHKTNNWRLHWSSGHTRTVFEIWRDVEYANADPSLTNVAAIVAAEVGYGLRFFADWDGYAVPAGDTNFSVPEGALIEHPADVIRHRLAILGGQGHASLDPDWTTTAIANLGAGAKFAC